MKIVFDAFGGDNSPIEAVKGAVLALEARRNFSIVLVGQQEIIFNELRKYQYDKDRITVIDAPEIISNDDSPVLAVRKKKNSSIVVGLKLLNDIPGCEVFVSAGSTGAVLTAATLLLKRAPGVIRPALAPVLPASGNKQVVLIDCGANVEVKPEMLAQFALIGTAYARAISNNQEIKVGLLSNGREVGKGTSFIKDAYDIIAQDDRINFIGNIEARDILSGEVDVVVADGFSGNIALKASEGTALMMLKLIKESILNNGIRAKIGYLFLKPVFKEIKKTLDYNDNGGAVLLGLDKLVIKTHGSSKAKSFKAAILQAASIAEKGLITQVSSILTE
ncbi:MAG: phosphate acyltransferase PlsX [Clostridiales bacterium]|jgi:glycerol-3-phosphate acyltransferase PlsX|nr:phosphate acyltransferase PlsX [Clostridiales bacterium]